MIHFKYHHSQLNFTVLCNVEVLVFILWARDITELKTPNEVKNIVQMLKIEEYRANVGNRRISCKYLVHANLKVKKKMS